MHKFEDEVLGLLRDQIPLCAWEGVVALSVIFQNCVVLPSFDQLLASNYRIKDGSGTEHVDLVIVRFFVEDFRSNIAWGATQ